MKTRFLRRDFGIKSNDYRRFAFVGDHAIGITNNFTGEARLELLEKHQTTGLGGNYLISQLGVFNLAGAASYNSRRTGGLVATGFQRQSAKGVNFSANIQWMSRKFVQLGNFRRGFPRYLLNTFIGFNPYDTASLGASFLRQENRKCPNLSLLTVFFTQVISSTVSMSVSGMTNVRGKNNQSVFLTLSYGLSDSTTLNAVGTAQKNGNQGTVQVTRNLPIGPGYGYNLYAANGQQENYQASFAAQNDIGTYTVASDYQGGIATGQLQAQGSVAFLNRSAYLSRELGDSFAVVQVPGYSDVRIYYQNQYVGRTDEEGTLLVPGLLPYQVNPLRVELQDLPLDAQIKSAEKNPIPYYLSGLVVDFPIKPSSSAIMKLVLPSGEPVPLDAVVTVNDIQFPVGQNGLLYLTELKENNILYVVSKDENYKCVVEYIKTQEPIPDLGVVQCQ